MTTNDHQLHVLDHGYVRLVDFMGDDVSISRAARVSYDAPPRPEDRRLIAYLWENEHTSPFEAVTVTFEVMAPIFVLRQWHRHRTQSYNELSARYRELPDIYYTPALEEITTQHSSNKQMRSDDANPMAEDAQKLMDAACDESFSAYRELLAMDVPRELARIVLPVATYSHMFCTMNLLNLFRFLKLRVHEHAQYEIRVYAEAMLQLASEVAPIACQAFTGQLEGEQ